MLQFSEANAVLRLWTLSELPPEFQQAIAGEGLDATAWVAHIPRELIDEPLVALLALSGMKTGPVKTILLSDGSRLLSGALESLPRESGFETQGKASQSLAARATL